MEEGWVYVLVNSTVPGLAKVGRTTRAPGDRAAELSGVTGVATPFIVAYQMFFADCHAGEREVHAELDRRGLRVAPNREFFRGTASEIIDIVLRSGNAAGALASPDQEDRRGEAASALLEIGDRALHGTGDTLQDTGEALRCYRLAILRGSASACERAGGVFVRLYASNRSRANRKRALTTLKEGVRRGNLFCYAGLAEIFALDGHRDNFEKSWRLFFTGADGREADMVQACCSYVGQCLHLGLTPAYLPELRARGDEILAALLVRLDQSPTERPAITTILRWTYAELFPQPSPGARARPDATGAKVFASFFKKKSSLPCLK